MERNHGRQKEEKRSRNHTVIIKRAAHPHKRNNGKGHLKEEVWETTHAGRIMEDGSGYDSWSREPKK